MSTLDSLQTRLASQADAKTKDWWEKYMKFAIGFRGVKMAGIREALHAWYTAERIGSRFKAEEKIDLALDLLREPLAEDKLAGILFLQEILLPKDAIKWARDLPKFAALFDQGYIADWNTCDWFCVRVLGPLAARNGEPCARAIAAWQHAETLWQRRAAGVAFVNLAKQGDNFFPGFVDMLLAVCTTTVQSQDRFAQTGTGWTLRELGAVAPARVANFLANNQESFSKEGWHYIRTKMPHPILDLMEKE